MLLQTWSVKREHAMRPPVGFCVSDRAKPERMFFLASEPGGIDGP